MSVINRRLRAKDLGDECRYCGSIENLTIDHIQPRTLGGSDEFENLQVLCRGCNLIKRGMTVEELRVYCEGYISKYEARLIITRKILENL